MEYSVLSIQPYAIPQAANVIVLIKHIHSVHYEAHHYLDVAG